MSALVEKIARLGPTGIDRQPSGKLVVLATSGIDALDSYFSRYLPQLVLAVVIPVTVIVVVLGADWISALIIAVTIPLIPLFMSLVGASTKARMGRQMRLLQRLSGHFLDIVAGLPTLKIFGRAKAQVAAIREIADQYRTATMATLRVAFLSSLILELLATISVALVAVAVGLRLLGGHLSLATALFVLILAPEAYLPLRLLGTNYHASAEGLKAAEEVFGILERPLPSYGTRRDVPDPSRSTLRVAHLEVRYPGRVAPALSNVTLRWNPVRSWRWPGPADAANRRCSACYWVSSPRGRATFTWGAETSPNSILTPGGNWWPGSRNDRISLPDRSSTTSALAGSTPPTMLSVRQSPTPVSMTWWRGSRTGWRRCSDTVEPGCRRGSDSGWHWPERSCATHRCCSSTNPPPISTAGQRRACCWPVVG